MGRKAIDLTGNTYGRLTVISRAGKDKHGNYLWNCKCSCKSGKIITVRAASLKSGKTQSCGCLHKEKMLEAVTTHGKTHDKIYGVWKSINKRCNNPNCKDYPNYGGRGITVCERWLVFENFYEDVSKLPHFGEKGYSLDRINNDGDYEPSNVRWAMQKQQIRNTRVNHLVEYQGQEMTLGEAAEKIGINYRTLNYRYHTGKRGDELFKPVRPPK